MTLRLNELDLKASDGMIDWRSKRLLGFGLDECPDKRGTTAKDAPEMCSTLIFSMR